MTKLITLGSRISWIVIGWDTSERGLWMRVMKDGWVDDEKSINLGDV